MSDRSSIPPPDAGPGSTSDGPDPPPDPDSVARRGSAIDDALARLGEALGGEIQPIRLIGRGRMAGVYLAREPALDRHVAVKVLRPELAQDETAIRRFEREARAAASLSHPNIVAVHRFGRLTDGRPYLIMQYVPGRSLEQRLSAEGPLDPEAARKLLVEMASALAAAHSKGFVHRDVRPANVLLDDETGRTLLADFGIAALLPTMATDAARLTRSGERLGDPAYTSPEQLLGEKLTGAADVYSLGVLGYVIQCGEGPFAATSEHGLILAHLHEEPRPLSSLVPHADPVMTDLLRRCLAKPPEHRPRADAVAGRLAPDSPQRSHGLIARIKRRRLFQIIGAYVAAAWAGLEVVDQLVGQDLASPTAYRLALVTAIAGFPLTGVLGWFHGERGRQRPTAVELWIILGIAVGWLVAVLIVLDVRITLG